MVRLPDGSVFGSLRSDGRHFSAPASAREQPIDDLRSAAVLSPFCRLPRLRPWAQVLRPRLRRSGPPSSPATRFAGLPKYGTRASGPCGPTGTLSDEKTRDSSFHVGSERVPRSLEAKSDVSGSGRTLPISLWNGATPFQRSQSTGCTAAGNDETARTDPSGEATPATRVRLLRSHVSVPPKSVSDHVLVVRPPLALSAGSCVTEAGRDERGSWPAELAAMNFTALGRAFHR